MSQMIESLLFIQALLAHTDRLRDLLGEDWPAIRDRLLELLNHLAQAEEDDQVLMVVDDIIAAAIDSRAAELVRALLTQARLETGSLDSETRSICLTDPTSGQPRDVDVVSPGTVALSVSRANVITAGQALAEGLSVVEEYPQPAAVGKPEPPQTHVLCVNLWIEDEQGYLFPHPAVLIQGNNYIFLFAIEPRSREGTVASEVFIEPPELQTSLETTAIIELFCPFLEAANEMGYVRHKVTYRQGSGFPPQKFLLKPNTVGQFYLTARLLVKGETIYREVLVLHVEKEPI
jgi:hypothetical protein